MKLRARNTALGPRRGNIYNLHQLRRRRPVNNDRVHNSFTHNQRKIVIQPKNIHIRPMSLQKVYGENNPEFVSDILAVEYRDNGNGEIEIVYHIENVFGYNDTADTLGEIIYTCIDSKGEAINKNPRRQL